GRVDHWTISPRQAAPDRWTARGGPWQPSISLPLEPGAGVVEVWAEAPVVARVTAIAPPEGQPPEGPPTDAPPPEAQPVDLEPEATVTTPPPTASALRALTRTIATARDGARRSEALLARAEALERLG